MNNIINKIIEENDKWSDPDYCLRAVKKDSWYLKYIKNKHQKSVWLLFNKID